MIIIFVQESKQSQGDNKVVTMQLLALLEVCALIHVVLMQCAVEWGGGGGITYYR